MADTPVTPQHKWWQWLLLYPAFAASLWSAVPAVWKEYQAWRTGVKTSQLETYRTQERLWKANLDCLQFKPTYVVPLDDTREVGVTLCRSGDVLLRYVSDQANTTYTWVPYPGVKQASLPADTLRRGVLIVGRSQCVGLQSTLILHVVHALPTWPGVCTLDAVQLATGKVLSQQRVNCETFCDPT